MLAENGRADYENFENNAGVFDHQGGYDVSLSLQELFAESSARTINMGITAAVTAVTISKRQKVRDSTADAVVASYRFRFDGRNAFPVSREDAVLHGAGGGKCSALCGNGLHSLIRRTRRSSASIWMFRRTTAEADKQIFARGSYLFRQRKWRTKYEKTADFSLSA